MGIPEISETPFEGHSYVRGKGVAQWDKWEAILQESQDRIDQLPQDLKVRVSALRINC